MPEKLIPPIQAANFGGDKEHYLRHKSVKSNLHGAPLMILTARTGATGIIIVVDIVQGKKLEVSKNRWKLRDMVTNTPLQRNFYGW